MTTVTITVTVDAEGEVRLGLPANGANATGRPPRLTPFADELVPLPGGPMSLLPVTPIRTQPSVAAMSRGCPVHGVPWRHVPPGVSKRTGKPYDGFAACPEPSCSRRPE
jgi:hypothetical protein